MSQYVISELKPSDQCAYSQVDALLKEEGITRDANLDHTCVMYDEDYRVIATGSCFGNTLRCFAVRKDHQGEGLLNEIITHLTELQMERGYHHLFLYTKIRTAPFFRDLGFHEIARVDGSMVFMENRKHGFSRYLQSLSPFRKEGISSAIVMNANPFTLGHLHLAEQASAESDTVHLFVLSEDVSLVPFSVRKRLVQAGVAHLPNVICHDSGPYMISNATFPSYFLKDEADVTKNHARLDIEVFGQVAAALHITKRYVGEEPKSVVTASYNQCLKEQLPKKGIQCIEIPRLEKDGAVVSASDVRKAIREQEWDKVKKMVPDSTYQFFRGQEAEVVIRRIMEAEHVIHH